MLSALRYPPILSAWPWKSSLICVRSKSSLRILFFGTDEFSVPTLSKLHGNLSAHGIVKELDVCCLSMKTITSNVEEYSKTNGIRIHFYPPNVENDQYDIGIVSSFGKLLPKKLISQFKMGLLNVHGSLLPRWRGASPIAHAIMNGDTVTGISIMEVEPHHFDAGHILAQKSIGITPDVTRKELTSEMAVMGADLLMHVIENLDSFRSQKMKQDESKVTYAPIIHKQMFAIDFNMQNASEIWNRYRALCDLGRIYSYWESTGELVKFDRLVRSTSVERAYLDKHNPNAKCGQAVYISAKSKKDQRIFIKCKDCSWVSFERFYYGEKKVMNSKDFCSGFMSKHKRRKDFCFVTKMTSGCEDQ